MFSAIFFAATASAQSPTDCFEHGRASPGRPNLQNPVTITSSVYPIKVWYEDNNNKAADIAAEALSVLELSWMVQVDQIGFNAPVLPDLYGGPELDVYVIEYFFGSAFVAADSYDDLIPGDGYNSASNYMVLDSRLPIDWVEGFAAHEFNHVLQWGYDYSEWTLPLWEGTATAAEKWTLGSASTWETTVPSYQEAPYFPSLLADSWATWYGAGVGYYYEYGAAVFVLHLDEVLGSGDGTKGVELWEATANEGLGLEPDAVDAFTDASGVDLGEALNLLAMTRFLTGDDWDARGLADAANWGNREAVPSTAHTADELPLAVTWPAPPMITGQAFAELDLTTGAVPPVSGTDVEQWVEVTVTSAAANESGIQVMWWNADGTVGDAGDWGPAPLVEIPLADVDRVAVGLTNLGATGWDGDDNFYVNGDQILNFAIVEHEIGYTTPTEPTDPTGPAEPTDPTDLTDPTSPGIDGGHPVTDAGESSAGGCGCDAASPAGLGLLPLGLLVLGMRRSR